MTVRAKVRGLLFLSVFPAALCLVAAGQQVATNPAQSQAQGLSLTQPVPIDPQITLGRLPNGLRYYIRTNTLPEKRIELRLAVNAESETQRGRE